MSRFPFHSSFLGRAAATLLLAGSLSACGDDLELPPDETENPDPQAGTHMAHVDNGDGSYTTTVNATSSAEWIGLDLDEGAQVSATEDAVWDLAFMRFNVRTRGGVSGTGDVAVAVLTETDFEQVTQAPADGYVADAEDGPDRGEDPDSAFQMGDGWYAYDMTTHALTARRNVYVVRSDAGDYFKVAMQSYYDDAGTPGMLSFRWAKVPGPASGGSAVAQPSQY
ncbi:HmuY family protein [Myxococcus sp. Y35]|uniref:HmuY family protein n=1 Tax=Pseudomyxococcus flavus TaxID=3115648 RepID=UPI003CE6825D